MPRRWAVVTETQTGGNGQRVGGEATRVALLPSGPVLLETKLQVWLEWSWSMRSAMPRNTWASGEMWLAIARPPRPWDGRDRILLSGNQSAF